MNKCLHIWTAIDATRSQCRKCGEIDGPTKRQGQATELHQVPLTAGQKEALSKALRASVTEVPDPRIAALESEVARLQQLAINNGWQVNYMCSEIGQVFGMSELTPSEAVQCVRDLMKMAGNEDSDVNSPA